MLAMRRSDLVIDRSRDEPVDALVLLIELLARLTHRLIGAGESGFELARVEDVLISTAGAVVHEFGLRLEPTDRFPKLITAGQACERDHLIGEGLIHG